MSQGYDPSQPRILILDDDEEMLDLFTELIEDAGWTARAIRLESIDQVVTLVQQEAPDLLILDLVVHRNFLGWDAIRQMQSTGHPTPPIIVCTASEVEDIPEDVSPAVKAILPKPFDLDSLYGAIQRALINTAPLTNGQQSSATSQQF